MRSDVQASSTDEDDQSSSTSAEATSWANPNVAIPLKYECLSEQNISSVAAIGCTQTIGHRLARRSDFSAADQSCYGL